ncbi:uncharacterized protein LOC143264434 isoform X2 [Megachile rotundata]|uniref:uncharacterized protein LOC143264434 isoform X2 n=1 Tax=Megachile rotundata TaxID=143995 RepID=UPI003FD6B7ED
MNRLKYVLGVRVPRRIPSSTAITHEHASKEICKKHSSEIHLRPLLKGTRLFSPRTRRINDFRSFHCAGPARNETLYVSQRSRPKSDSISLKRPPLERKFPADCVQRRRNSTCQSRKPSNIKRHFVPTNQMIQEMVKSRKISKLSEKHDMSLRKEPRTYAQLIANYSQMMYVEPKILKDSVSTATVNGIHRSPFSTVSVVSTKWKSKPKSVRSGNLRVASPNMLNQEAKFSSDTCTTRYEYRNDQNLTANKEDRNTYERLSYSYAMMIEKYSNTLDVDANDGTWNNLVPKCNPISKLNDFSSILVDSMNRTMENGLREGPSARTSVHYGEKKSRITWMSKVEDVIKDLKRITLKKETVDCKSSEKSALNSVSECAEWMDRVVSAHKKKKPSGVNSELSSSALNSPIMKETSASEATVIASSTKSSSIADYIKRGPVSGTTSSQSPTNVATASAKQPQIELRMTPSQNESVVSINVDEHAARSAGTSIKEQLSVVISSNKNNPKVEASNTNFDSMQISISENTVPVKQIEFSINGKPVSELKSIVARADKLDVVTSMDKVEIRIPQKEGTAKQSNTFRATSNPSQVLNLQIAAKFNEPRAKPKDTGIKTSTAIPSTTPASVPTPAPPPIPTPTQAPPYNNPRTQSLATNTRSVDANKSNMNLPSNNPQSTINENSDTRTPVDERTPSNVIPWWSSEDPFKKIKKKRNPPTKVAAFNTLKKVEGARQKIDESTPQSSDFVETEGPSKDLPLKKPILEENPPDPIVLKQHPTKKTKITKKIDFSKQNILVRNPRKLMQIKLRSPKTIKYVPVNPQRYLVLQSRKELAGEVKMKSKSEDGSKDDAKSKNVSGDAKDAQHQNTVLKPTKNVEKPDNKSGDVSAKVADKEQVKDKNLLVEEEQRVKQILKSMKPIEKRKDGTLIDYGVVVPSRKPSNIRHVPSTRVNKIEKTTTRQEEIEPRKAIFKNEPESKSVQKVDSEKITFVKKEVEPNLEEKNKNRSLEKKDENSVIPVKKLQTQVISEDSGIGFSDKNQPLKVKDTKDISADTGKDLSKIDKNKASEVSLKLSENAGSKSSSKPEKEKLTTSKNPVKSSTNVVDTKSTPNKLTQNHVEERGSKTASGDKKLDEKVSGKPPKAPVKASDNVPNSSKTKMADKVHIVIIPPEKQASKSLLKSEPVERKKEDERPSQATKVFIKFSDTNVPGSKLNNVTPEKEAFKSTPKTEAEEKKKLDAKLSTQPSKVSIKPSDKNVTGKQKVDKLANVTSGKEASKSTLKSEAEGKKKLDTKLSRQPSKVSIKSSDTNVTGKQKVDKLANVISGKEASKSTLKSEAEGKKKLDTKLSRQPSKVSIKPSDTNVTGKQKVDKLTNVPPGKEATKSTLKSEAEEKKILDAKLSTQPSKVSIKPSDTNVTGKQKVDKLANVTSGKEASKSTLKWEAEGKKKLDTKLSRQPSKVSIKASDTNVTGKQKVDKLTNVPPGKEATKGTLKSEAEEKKILDAKLSTQPSKVSIKPSDTNVTGKQKVDKLANVTPGKEASKSTPKSEAKEKKKLDAKLSTQPSKVSIKSSNTNTTGKPNNVTLGKEASKSTPKSEAEEKKKSDAKSFTQPSKGSAKPGDSTANFSNPSKEPTSQLQFTEKAGGNTLTPGAQEKVHSSFSADKKVTRTDSLPLTGAIVPPSQKSSDKAAKNDSKSSEESNVQSLKKLITSQTAPLAGTINYRPEKKLDNLSSSSAKEKTVSEVIKQKDPKSGKGGGSGPAAPTGPAGLVSKRSFTMSQEFTNLHIQPKSALPRIKNLNKFDRRAKSGNISYRSNKEQSDEMKSVQKTERPEKSILYSSWLQRFKSRLDDDNVT